MHFMYAKAVLTSNLVCLATDLLHPQEYLRSPLASLLYNHLVPATEFIPKAFVLKLASYH
jgi:hypothetical protein